MGADSLRSVPSPNAQAARLIDTLQASIPEVASDIAEAICDEVPGYAAFAEEASFVEGVRGTARQVLNLLVDALRGEELDREDFAFTFASMRQRSGRGLKVEDALGAHRVGTRVIWRHLEAAARADDAPMATALVGPLIEFVGCCTTALAENFSQVESDRAAAGERTRRDLLEDLLAGREPTVGPRAEAMFAARLTFDRGFVVVSAQAHLPEACDEHALFYAAGVLGRAGTDTLTPCSVLRGHEIVAVLPSDREHSHRLAVGLRGAQEKLAVQNVELRIGVSSVVDTIAAIPRAYEEATDARLRADPTRPVLCLFELTAFEYLMMKADETTARLVSPAVAGFVAEDLEGDGALVTTLIAYIEADLNVKSAAERLYVHVNTAHARLARIAERTGRDVRSSRDLTELWIAVELARPLRRSQSELGHAPDSSPHGESRLPAV